MTDEVLLRKRDLYEPLDRAALEPKGSPAMRERGQITSIRVGMSLDERCGQVMNRQTGEAS